MSDDNDGAVVATTPSVVSTEMTQKPKGQLRHILSMIAGVLVTLGFLGESDASTVVDGVTIAVGVVLTIAAQVWSWISKSDPEPPTA